MQDPQSIKPQEAGVSPGAPPGQRSGGAAQGVTVMPLDTSVDGYRTAPDHTNPGWPPGVPFIVGNEACERFSFYGMRAILYVHLVSLYAVAAVSEDAAKASATATVHL